MRKNNVWVVLAVIYVFVIGAVVMYRMNSKKESTTPTTSMPETEVSPTTSPAAMELMSAEFESTATSANVVDVKLKLLDPATFESAGYTLELVYDPAVLKISDVLPGNVWEKNIILQEDTETDGKLIYSVGRELQSTSAGGDVMATVKFQILDNTAQTTEIRLSQQSKSASENSAKTIVAEPLIIELK